MPNENNKILKYNPGEKSLKVPFIIYADLECIFQKIDSCQNNLEKSYTEKKAKHKPSGYSLVTCCSYDKSKTERTYYRGIDCMEIFCKDLKCQTMKIINYEKKKIIPLTNEEKEFHEKQKICYICKKEFCTNEKEFKQKKVKDHCHYTGQYRGAAHSICNLRYKISKNTPIVFHNGSSYDYHFIIKKLAKEFKGTVPVEKTLNNGKVIIYKLKFIDSNRFMEKLLSSLVENLSEINKKKPMDEFIDNFRSMLASLLRHV